MRQTRIAILLLCLAASLLTGCPDVPKDSPNPDGINSCPPDCECIDNGDSYTVRCGGELE